MSHEPALYTRAQKLAKLSDEALLQLDFAPGSDAHYDQIMEICSRGLKDPEAGTTACNFLPELKAHLETRPRLGCHPSHPAPGCGPCARGAAAPLASAGAEDAQGPAVQKPALPAGARVLRLSLKKCWFDVMATGEKMGEYRKPSQYIKSRLLEKDGVTPKPYDFVLFYNGYGAHLPWFVSPYRGFSVAEYDSLTDAFANGLRVAVAQGDYIIRLGMVHSRGNLRPNG